MIKINVMLKSNLMKNKLHRMLETPKTLSTRLCYYVLYINIVSKNLKDTTMGNQQETKLFNKFIK
jgi:hypothetical protein